MQCKVSLAIMNANSAGLSNVDEKSSSEMERLCKLELVLTSKYGVLISMKDMAEILHKSYDGFRMSMIKNDSQAAESLNKAKKKIGRRVYFRSLDVAKIIMD